MPGAQGSDQALDMEVPEGSILVLDMEVPGARGSAQVLGIEMPGVDLDLELLKRLYARCKSDGSLPR
eukprot:4887061-Pyramimonas_sp.AAC.1